MSYILKINNNNPPRNIVHEKKIQMERYRITYEIPTDEEGTSKGGKDYCYGFLFQDKNMVTQN